MDLKTMFLVFVVLPIGATILFFLAAWYVFIRKPRQQNGQQPPPPPAPFMKWIEKKWNAWKNLLLLFAGIFSIHLIVWMMFPEFWVEWWSQPWFMCYQILLGLGLYLFSQKGHLSKIGALLCILGFFAVGRSLYHAIRWADEANVVIRNIPREGPIPGPTRGILPHSKEGEQYVREYLTGKLARRHAEALALIIKRESGFNQYERDGKTAYRRRPTPDNASTAYVGLAQISENAHKKNIDKLGWDKYNIYTRDGNLNYAVWLVQNEGFGPWRETYSPTENVLPPPAQLPAEKESYISSTVIVAPPERWSDPYPATKFRSRFGCSPPAQVKVRINMDDNRIIYDGPDKQVDYGTRINLIEFQSIEEDSVTVPCSVKE